MIDTRRARTIWRRQPVIVRDAPLALLFAGAAAWPALDSNGTQLGNLADRPDDALTVLVVALLSLPLAVRRRWPAICLALVSLGFALDQLYGYHTVASSALPIALMSAGAHLERHRRPIAITAAVAYVPLAVALDRLGTGDGTAEGLAGFVTFFLLLAVAWGVGAWLRQTRAAEAERRRHVAESTRAAERTRIARELHDVVTHHVTAMVVQAEAARYLTAAPDRLDQTLTAVTDTGRRAISDLRKMLDLLDPGHDTLPAGGLGSLVEQTRRAGQPVEFVAEGTPPEPAGSAEATAYRVVQEALTNAMKYDHGGHTAVHVRYGAREISVRISSSGSGSGAASPGGSGRGLAGLRERVGVLGGEFSAGPEPDGGFVVRALIPAGGAS
ncbi:histidine kinase [Actinoplanes sp. NPDC051861]|uniref:sensor histidine kinase n=1 Tax=Actinoplanes sp. NPDC051861 TaxID=3155170 RepID=UPI0034295008